VGKIRTYVYKGLMQRIMEILRAMGYPWLWMKQQMYFPDIQTILQTGESKTVEFKTSFGKESIETLVA
jgi:hypothetical protein